MLALLYCASPNVRLPGGPCSRPGAVFAVLLWIVVSALFAFYVANFGSYNKTYGTMAGVIVGLRVAVPHEHRGPAGRRDERRARAHAASSGRQPAAERRIQLPARNAPKGDDDRAVRRADTAD